MKKLLIILALFCLAVRTSAQTHACCNTDAITEFANLTNREDFRMVHKDPLPYTYTGAAGTDISFPAPDGTPAHGFLFKAKKPTNKFLLVYQEWYGLNDYIKKESEKLYDDLSGTVNVLAVDLYDKYVATNREDAAKKVRAVSHDRLDAIMQAALDYAGKSARIATIGWCFGGGMALQSGLKNGSQNVGVVMYYGAPERNVDRLKTLNAPVLAVFADKDDGLDSSLVQAFEKNMQAAGKKLTIKHYNAGHGFANPSNPIYDSEATKDAYKHAIAFLRKQLL
ncbi:MAG TPA: dienelactone hydrolase family protein [Chitinophaga sp.]|uniref:dienelactone hydrolase family protein n=1 Tax=Chitinophaga sp. TaxID=1869181 RepID=UPI002D0A19D3|nr:dienelactone hydrolase family protein [Chitinophaga sp.]HVI44327.1 dienelactone hydrolase family protein [Chitinophaga sp.]